MYSACGVQNEMRQRRKSDRSLPAENLTLGDWRDWSSPVRGREGVTVAHTC